MWLFATETNMLYEFYFQLISISFIVQHSRELPNNHYLTHFLTMWRTFNGVFCVFNSPSQTFLWEFSFFFVAFFGSLSFKSFFQYFFHLFGISNHMNFRLKYKQSLVNTIKYEVFSAQHKKLHFQRLLQYWWPTQGKAMNENRARRSWINFINSVSVCLSIWWNCWNDMQKSFIGQRAQRISRASVIVCVFFCLLLKDLLKEL